MLDTRQRPALLIFDASRRCCAAHPCAPCGHDRAESVQELGEACDAQASVHGTHCTQNGARACTYTRPESALRHVSQCISAWTFLRALYGRVHSFCGMAKRCLLSGLQETLIAPCIHCLVHCKIGRPHGLRGPRFERVPCCDRREPTRVKAFTRVGRAHAVLVDTRGAPVDRDVRERAPRRRAVGRGKGYCLPQRISSSGLEPRTRTKRASLHVIHNR